MRVTFSIVDGEGILRMMPENETDESTIDVLTTNEYARTLPAASPELILLKLLKTGDQHFHHMD